MHQVDEVVHPVTNNQIEANNSSAAIVPQTGSLFALGWWVFLSTFPTPQQEADGDLSLGSKPTFRLW